MNRIEFIEEFRRLVDTGEIVDIESFCYANEFSRTKAKKILNGQEYEAVLIRKHSLYIKK